MKKRWLSLAVALLMVFASIAQGLTPVLAEVEVEIGQTGDALKIEEKLPIDGDEEGLSFGNDFPADQVDGGLTVELGDLSLDLDANGIRNESPNAGAEGALQSNDGVQYISRSWNGSEVVSETLECASYSRIDDDTEDLSGWYVVDSRLDLDDERLNVVGTANIILVDGARLYNEDGIRVSPGATLNIYGQAGDSGELYLDADTNNNAALGGDEGEGCGTITIHGGHITADTNNLGEDAAGIGGGEDGSGSTITIYGGKVTGIGGSVNSNGGAGIGGGGAGSGGTITIYGGSVSARGGANAAGIGGGDEGSSGNITIYGGSVGAYGGSFNADGGAGIGGGNERDADSITIHGGNITAVGGCDGAGIGGGDYGSGGIITINGGEIHATGGANGAGIGSGQRATSGVIIINDGNITAQGGEDAAGIGGGDNAVCTKITIKGGTVNATGGDYAAGIGGGDRDVETVGGEITISGGTVTAQGGKDGAGIGGEDAPGGNITINGGEITANGGEHSAGIGGGDDGNSGNITISGGEVTATGGMHSAGIGGGEGANGDMITIKGGTVNATGGDYAAGIGGGFDGNGGTINISGGKVKATGTEGGAGIGGGRMYDFYGGGKLNDFNGGGGIITISGGDVIADVGDHEYRGAGIGSGHLGGYATITLTHSGTNSVRVQTPSFIPDTKQLKEYKTTLTMDKSFKDQKTGTIYQAKTYTEAELRRMKKLNLVPSDNAYPPEKKPSRITLQPKTAVYTGKTINIGKASVVGSTGKVTYAYYSDAKCTKKVSEHKNAGVYYVKARVAADASYRAATSKAVKLTIKKASNPITVSPNALTLRKDALTKAIYFAIKVENAKGKVTYKAYSKARKAGIRVTKAGFVTIPKHCKRGTYKIRVLAHGTQNYKARRYYVTVSVK